MRDELLALLEEGPQSTQQLADVLKAAPRDVFRELKALRDEGQVWRRNNLDGTFLWTLNPTRRPRQISRSRRSRARRSRSFGSPTSGGLLKPWRPTSRRPGGSGSIARPSRRP